MHHRFFLSVCIGLIMGGVGCYTPPTASSPQALKSGNVPAQCGSHTEPAMAYFEIPGQIYTGEEFAADATCTTGEPAVFRFSVTPQGSLSAWASDILVSPRLIGTSDERNAPRLSYITLPKAGQYTITVEVIFNDESKKQASIEVTATDRPLEKTPTPAVVLGPGKPPEHCGERGAFALQGYFTVNNLNPLVGETMTFDASCSVGAITKVEWDVDMMECLERKSPGITRTMTAENITSANEAILNQALEACFERVVTVRPEDVNSNNFPAMFQTYTPAKPGVTRARVRVTDARGRREVKHLVYTVHERNAHQEVLQIAPLQFSLWLNDGARPIPHYPDNRVVYLAWPLESVRKGGKHYLTSAVSAPIQPVVSHLYGDQVEYQWQSIGKSPEKDPIPFETPWKKFQSLTAAAPGETNLGVSLPLPLPAPAQNLFPEAREEAAKHPLVGFPADPAPPSIAELRFHRAFPYDVTLQLKARAGSNQKLAAKKIQFVSPWDNSLFKTQIIFIPIPFVMPLPSSAGPDIALNQTLYKDYIDLDQYYNQAYGHPIKFSETFDDLYRKGLEGYFWNIVGKNPSPFVVDPGQKIYVSNYTLQPYHLLDTEALALDTEKFFNDTYALGQGSRLIRPWRLGEIFFAPQTPGAYTARATARLQSGEESIDELAYRVRELIHLDIQPAPLSGDAQVGQIATFGARASKGEILLGRWVVRLGNQVVYDSQNQPWERDGGLLQYRFTDRGTYKVELTVTEAETFRQAKKTLEYTVLPSSRVPQLPNILHIAEKGVAGAYDQNNLLFNHGALLFISVDDSSIRNSVGRVEWDFNADNNFSDHVCTTGPRHSCETVETQVLGSCPMNGRCIIRVRIYDNAGKIIREGQGSYQVRSLPAKVLCPPESERFQGHTYDC